MRTILKKYTGECTGRKWVYIYSQNKIRQHSGTQDNTGKAGTYTTNCFNLDEETRIGHIKFIL